MEKYKTMKEAAIEINPILKEKCFAKPPVEKFYSNYIFELDKVEEENLEKYMNKLKKKYGSYGFLTYEFTPTGIGTVIKVKSSHKKKAKEITNLSSW
jgi:hypothetical protein